MNPLDNLERLTQRFVEGTFHRFFGKKLHPADLTDQLIALVEAEGNRREGNLLPANYQVMLNPADYAAIVQQNSREEIASELISHLTTFAIESNYQFDDPLRVTLEQNESVQSGRIQVSTTHETIDRGRP